MQGNDLAIPTVFPPREWGGGGRGRVVVAKYPNQSMYQIQSNDVLKRHDLIIIQAATEMAGESDLAQAILYCNKPWKKADPRPSSNSEGGSQRRGLHFLRQMLSTAVPTKLKLCTRQAPKLDWGHSIFHGPYTRSNKLLSGEITPGCPLRSGKKRERERGGGRKTNWIGEVHPTSLTLS